MNYADFMLTSDMSRERAALEEKMRKKKRRMKQLQNRMGIGRFLGKALALAVGATNPLAGIAMAAALSAAGSGIGAASAKNVGKINKSKFNFYHGTIKGVNKGLKDFRRQVGSDILANSLEDALMYAVYNNIDLGKVFNLKDKLPSVSSILDKAKSIKLPFSQSSLPSVSDMLSELSESLLIK